MHGTTIVGVRKNGSVTIAGDGQVSLGNTIIKGTAQKIRSIKNEGYEIIAGFAGSTADAFTLIATGVAGQAPGTETGEISQDAGTQSTIDKLTKYDPDLSGSLVAIVEITGSSALAQLNTDNLSAIAFAADGDQDAEFPDALNSIKLVRRLTAVSSGSTTQDPSVGPGSSNTGGYKMTLVFTQRSGAVDFHGNGAATGGGIMNALTGVLF